MSKPVFSDMFAFSGRCNRKSYFLYIVCLTIVMMIVWGVALGFAFNSESVGVIVIVAYILSIIVGISGWIVGAQRCRDFGWTGWAVFITIIPLFGWVFPFIMLFVPGTEGPNRYGPDPLAQA
jgi:uncharacterized membrane protein YhaH (DUF805 family)